MPPPLIALEEHFLATAIAEDGLDKYSEQLKHVPGMMDKLLDLSDLRISQMDEGNVAIQVISHCAGAKTVAQCIKANNQLATAIMQHPDRFAGFATLDVENPRAAAEELRRCITDLQFTGALIDNHTPDATYLDGPEYDVLWSTGQELDVPIYIHPTWASDVALQAHYTGPSISTAASISIAHSAFGWHSDTATSFLRLFAAGVFERFPRLKIILGHFGEMIPFMLERICNLSRRWSVGFTRNFETVWRENVWVTTAGVWGVAPMATLLRNTSVDRIMFSVDYPFASSADGLKWWTELEQSGLLDEEGLRKIAFGNAERLLGLKAR
ncbi:2,3-dihydroxybenzoate decarboxylase [Cyphellophora attinorum]|uniref:2,3-dihydroxybenzoate decarboxylase n=1 Tax=Cyphellophora attinorum TaxID=1664694 RepID=A0A0N0NHX9_9EURO|nr:2,3-dihydroxybenzoate decarboxylase [Phialophora attinorum]KPI34799.1 2,3-dihydroxybenzoate decarboxylase [Phialophora attinorum]